MRDIPASSSSAPGRKRGLASQANKDRTLITVPHATCVNVPGHWCDSLAKTAATLFQKAIPHSRIFELPPNRLTEDVNRGASTGGAWWSGFREERATSSLLLDVHSFPPSYRKDEMYFIFNDDNLSLTRKVAGGAPIFRGVDNAITEGVANSLLIEFNEGLSETRLKELVQMVVGRL